MQISKRMYFYFIKFAWQISLNCFQSVTAYFSFLLVLFADQYRVKHCT